MGFVTSSKKFELGDSEVSKSLINALKTRGR